jgi:alanine racemase
MRARPGHVRTWVEIDAVAAKKNYATFRTLIGKKVQLWSVVKSNAYGHGLFAFSKLAARLGVDGFCVDSIVEALALRREGIRQPILVLGATLTTRYADAAAQNIIISISNGEALRALARVKRIPDFHIKIDTGMHRQGFYLEDIPKVVKQLKTIHAPVSGHLKGAFTHFASAKDINYPTYTDEQLKKFKAAVALFEQAGFRNLMKHAAATGATLIDPKYHMDAVRIGIGLYGLWPSKELEVQRGGKGRRNIELYPVLSWRTIVSEVKKLKAGDYVGYDLTERIPHDMAMAVLPIGYWHGLPRSLSSVGEILVNGKRARILGRVSMDITVVGLPSRTAIKPGGVATIIGRDGRDKIFAWEPAQKSGTSPYEFVTRLNPLMERIIT